MALTMVIDDFARGKVDTLYERFFPGLLTFATNSLGLQYAFLAEDCVQEAIMKAYMKRKEFASDNHLKFFLYACVHNDAINLLRKHKVHEAYLEKCTNTFGYEHDPHDVLIVQETMDRLYDAIDRLPEKYRLLVELSFEKGLKNKEIADMLGITLFAVKKQKAKLIKLLRQSNVDVRLLFVLFNGV
ncbi:MAG: RNA polymerase sigma factor [Prevotella sp.]